jgi:hypothetical protein
MDCAFGLIQDDRTSLKGWHVCQFGTGVTNGYISHQALHDMVVLPDTIHKTVLSWECTLGTTRAKKLSVACFAICPQIFQKTKRRPQCTDGCWHFSTEIIVLHKELGKVCQLTRIYSRHFSDKTIAENIEVSQSFRISIVVWYGTFQLIVVEID